MALAPSFTAPAVLPSLGVSRPQRTTTVLVADDDADIREVISFKLQMAGFHVLTAPNGAIALDMVAEHRPSVLILDIGMPELDGLTVCHELHASPETAGIPVLMLSGKDRPADIDLGFTIGADDYLTKPFSPAEMLRRVQYLLMTSGRG